MYIALMNIHYVYWLGVLIRPLIQTPAILGQRHDIYVPVSCPVNYIDRGCDAATVGTSIHVYKSKVSGSHTLSFNIRDNRPLGTPSIIQDDVWSQYSTKFRKLLPFVTLTNIFLKVLITFVYSGIKYICRCTVFKYPPLSTSSRNIVMKAYRPSR